MLREWSTSPVNKLFTEILLLGIACEEYCKQMKLIFGTFFFRIDYNLVIKVADFGLSESIDTSKQYFRQDKTVVVRLPIKWLALESINDGIFSEMSDVW